MTALKIAAIFLMFTIMLIALVSAIMDGEDEDDGGGEK